jgi:hypothetical protein
LFAVHRRRKELDASGDSIRMSQAFSHAYSAAILKWPFLFDQLMKRNKERERERERERKGIQ